MAGEKMREDQKQAVLFAAGIGVLMACVERAVIVSLWRMWAFLALNLLLLAIALTSKSVIQSHEIDGNGVDGGLKVARRKMNTGREECVALASDRVVNLVKGGDDCVAMESYVREEVEDELSKEELNRRAEAFIAMFRRHLVSDHAKSRTLQCILSHA